ncbi:MAG TPA: hypothetical protein VD866_33325 [Urbifossiella sp.]|nr:hypothetical protein [Urbifossiella sp.]
MRARVCVAIWTDALREAGVEPATTFDGLKAQLAAVTGMDVASPWFDSANRYCTSHHKTDQVAKLLTALSSPWFSSDARYCTSDHKRGQVSKVFTGLADKWWEGPAACLAGRRRRLDFEGRPHQSALIRRGRTTRRVSRGSEAP